MGHVRYMVNNIRTKVTDMSCVLSCMKVGFILNINSTILNVERTVLNYMQ